MYTTTTLWANRTRSLSRQSLMRVMEGGGQEVGGTGKDKEGHQEWSAWIQQGDVRLGQLDHLLLVW